jgi:ABC-2 type transport system permease protein
MTRLKAMAGAYREYWRINVLTTLEYRENFLLWFAFTVVYHGTALAALWVVLNAFPSMNGWTFRDMAFLYGLWMLAHAVNNTFFSEIGSIPEHVHEGEFDRLLVRPLDTLFQLIVTPGQVFPDELILAIAYFAAATWYSGIHVTALFLILVPLIALGGALIDLGINLIVGTLAFWFVRVDALQWIVTQLEQEFTRYPVSIYPRSVRLLLTFAFPFAFMNYFPATFFLNKPENALALPPAVGLLTPLIGLAFVSVAYAFWRFGLNRYQGVGH